MPSPIVRNLVVLAAGALVRFSSAAEFHEISWVTSATIDTDYFVVENLIEGPGLGYIEEPPHDRAEGSQTWVTDAPNGGAGVNYFDPLPFPEPQIVFDLGSDVELSEISLWGYADSNANGVREFSLRFATAADGETGFGNSIDFNPTYTAEHPMTPRQSFLFGRTVTARYVELIPLSNYFEVFPTVPGGDRVGIGEVAFEKVTVAAGPKAEVQTEVTLPSVRRVYPFSLEIRNTGDAPLTISGTEPGGPAAAALSVVSAPVSVPALGTAAISLQYDPTSLAEGPTTATLTIASNDAASPATVTFLLEVPPDLFHPIASVTSATEETDFYPAGNLIAGIGDGFQAAEPFDHLPGTGAAATLWVTDAPNGGAGADYFDPPPFPEPQLIFDLGTDVSLAAIDLWPYPGNVSAANSLREFSLRFATAAEGPAGLGSSITYNPTFELEVWTDTELTPRFDVTFAQEVTARYVELVPLSNFFLYDGAGAGGDRVGLAEVAFPKTTITPGPKLSAPATVDLPVISRWLDIDVTLRNVGQETVTISGVTFGGAGAAALTVVNAPTTIAAAATADLQVRLSPAGLAEGPFDASILIASNDPASPATIALAGTVPPPVFYPIAGVTSATEETDLYPARNLMAGIGNGFSLDDPYSQTITDGPTQLWVTDAPWGGTADYFPAPEPAPQLTFDLGADVALGEISLWGYSGTNANGVADFSLAFATSAEGPAAAGTSITYNPTFVADFGELDRLSFPFTENVSARYVVLTPLDNYYDSGLAPGGDRVGIGEVAFAIQGAVPPAPKFAITAVDRTSEGFVHLVFESVAGSTYTVSRSIDLTTWTDLAPAIPGQPGSSEFTDSAVPAGATRLYYRVRSTGGGL